ncbi:hypothetical protein [uncultured Rubinisphaera sp.]|uniref:hypothetical protein n=1 Tax=uncultured Rubinisphaera sp. TaxID=1678686 RepID=UPI0030D766D2
MPGAGGKSDKLGNHYELIWTTSILLRLAAGKYETLIVEPDGDDSTGIEFIADLSEGIREFHSTKRQRAVGDWSLAELTRSSATTGRSVLGDLIVKLNSDINTRCYFISSTGANDLREISERAKSSSTLTVFKTNLKSSSRLHSEYEKRFLPLAENDHDLAFQYLRRLTIVLIDEFTLQKQVEQQIAFLVYRPDLRAFEESEVRVLLGEFITQKLGNEIQCEVVWKFLADHGYQKKDWAIDSSLKELVRENNFMYTRSIGTDLINGAQLIRSETQAVLEKIHNSEASNTLLIAASAGMGKSCVISQIVETLTIENIPVLVIRMDRHGNAKLTQDIGIQMRLPRSPTVVLAGISHGSRSVLVIDQLDATSQVSGRYPDLWEVFDCIYEEAKVYPNMIVVIACRDFDLQHDHRLRKLKESNQTHVITLERLALEEVDTVITDAGGNPKLINLKQKDLLRTPLHLFLFLASLECDNPSYNFGDLGDLLQNYWEFKQRRVRDRLNGPSAWSEVIDRILEVMNQNLALYTSELMLDNWPDTVQAMLTEHVLIRDGNQIRFFHESFFDFAFARFFLRKGQSLVGFLLNGEQHLFRRAQVRQILTFLRDHDHVRYLTQLRELLSSPEIRFHIKRLVFAWLGSLPDPTHDEWEIVEPFLEVSLVQHHLLPPIRNNLAWFDLLDGLGVIETWLSSQNDKLPDRGIWFLIMGDVKKLRSERVAELLKPYRDGQGEWGRRIRTYFEFDGAHYSKPIQELFLKLLADGIFDQTSQDHHESWWDCLRLAGKQAPDFALEAISKWMDLQMTTWSEIDKNSSFNRLEYGSSAVNLIKEIATEVPLNYLDEILPRIEKVILNSLIHSKGSLQRDKVWYIQRNGDPIRVSEAIFDGLFNSIKLLSKEQPDELEIRISTLLKSNSLTLAVLLLRAWSSNPIRFGTTCLKYMSKNPDYLDIGYGSWSGKGTGHAAISRETIQACVPYANLEARSQLESKIIGYSPQDEVEAYKGWHERLLLESISDQFLSDHGSKRLLELRKKYPDQEITLPPRRSKGMQCIGSPILPDEAASFSDEQWLEAMRQYDYGWDDASSNVERELNGSAVELSRLLQPIARKQRQRFAALTEKMEDSIRPEYFEAILNGICSLDNLTNSERKIDDVIFVEIETELIIQCISRLHALPGHPCGRSICESFDRIADRNIPSENFEILRYYAIDDPDPFDDNWRNQNSNLEDATDNAHFYGYNSVRGNAARAIKSLLFADYSRSVILLPIIKQMANDSSIAVRTCVIEALLPALNHERDQAIKLFCQLCRCDPVIIGSDPFEEFVSYASSTHYATLRDLLQSGINSNSKSAQSAAARQICLAAFADELAQYDAANVCKGLISMRTAAAQVYAYNLGNDIVGGQCTEFLCFFFRDPSKEVRQSASECFRHLDDSKLNQYLPLIEAYIDSPSFPAASHDDLLRGMEDSTWQLPDLTLRIAKNFVKSVGSAGGDIANAVSLDSQIVSKLVVRLYSQSKVEAIHRECLDLIDEMELLGFHGIESQLAEHDR